MILLFFTKEKIFVLFNRAINTMGYTIVNCCLICFYLVIVFYTCLFSDISFTISQSSALLR